MTIQQMQNLDVPPAYVPSSGLTPRQFEKMLADAKAVRIQALMNARAALEEAYASNSDRRGIS